MKCQWLMLGLCALVLGCEGRKAPEKEAEPKAPASEPAAEGDDEAPTPPQVEIPVPADFAAEAADEIHADDYEAALKALAKEIE